MNAWGALTVVLVVATVVAGLVALGVFYGLVILQAQRQRYQFHAWRLQLLPQRDFADVHSASTRVPFDERALDTAYWGGVVEDAGHREDADPSFGRTREGYGRRLGHG